ncbi:alpha-ketoglutarate-dependent dioxygenase AlkB [Coralloluteibacterium thermophilus]|uniref:Alpha-ketoglutarate-dependent dioxygenase AlkB n=2 Tax=Coralloluteibacterium thermophilum TaxID=2707049 RepID=A0ABV9NLL1_9GAMM
MFHAMAQLPLFGTGPRTLLDDASGRIDYIPGFLAPDEARDWFERLRAGVRWQSGRRRMYEREVDVPRLVASHLLDDPHLPAPLAEAAARVRTAVDAPFNAVGLNLYRDAQDSVAPHNDRLAHIAEGHPIALLSLGDTRRMTVRAKLPPRRVLHVDLEPGSLFVMSYATQLHYDHGIPKQHTPVGPRISLAFRVRRREAATD